MREHEVPTHVQAEDRVLLGFTFPQIVAVTAVCAIAYGAYRYAPVGPSEVRMALAVVLGLVGIAMIVGKIGGRRLPLVAADLLKYRLGGAGPRWTRVPAGARRGARAAQTGEERPRPAAPDGEADEASPPQDAEEEEQGEGPAQRQDALPSPRLVRQATPQGGQGPPGAQGRDAGEHEP